MTKQELKDKIREYGDAKESEQAAFECGCRNYDVNPGALLAEVEAALDAGYVELAEQEKTKELLSAAKLFVFGADEQSVTIQWSEFSNHWRVLEGDRNQESAVFTNLDDALKEVEKYT